MLKLYYEGRNKITVLNCAITLLSPINFQFTIQNVLILLIVEKEFIVYICLYYEYLRDTNL